MRVDEDQELRLSRAQRLGGCAAQRAVGRDRVHHRQVQREQIDRIPLERERIEVALPITVDLLDEHDAHAHLHVAQLRRLHVHEAEHEPAPSLVRRDDGRLAEAKSHPRPGQPRDHEPGCRNEHGRAEERLEHNEPVCRRADRVHRPRAGRREDADAEDQRAKKRVGDPEHVAASQRAIAQREIRQGEEAVEQEQRAKRPGEECRGRLGKRAQVEPFEPLRAESVLPTRRLSVVREEAAANLLRDDAAEAEVGVGSPWLRRSGR